MKRKLIIPIILLLIAILSAINVFGANLDYLSYEKWSNNAKVKTVYFDKNARDNHIYGTLKYVADNDYLTVYSYLSFNESTLNGNDDLRVLYEFNMHGESYSFGLDSNGICEDYGEAAEVFETGQNFYYDGDAPQIISYAQYNGESTGGNVRIYLFVNGTRYLVYDNINIELPTTTKPTTAKKSTTKKAKASTKKSKSQSYKNSSRNTQRISATRVSTTKHSMTNKTSANIEVVNSESNKIMTPSTRYLLIFAICVMIIFLFMIMYNLGYSKGNKENVVSNDDDN